jgi:hypothetical protein
MSTVSINDGWKTKLPRDVKTTFFSIKYLSGKFYYGSRNVLCEEKLLPD